MKKVLFATTALVATAGMAAADVTFSGMSRFGVIYTDNGTTSSTDQTSRYLLDIDGSATSDTGMTFGARVRIRQNNGGSAPDPQTGPINSARFHMSTGGLTLRVGNINGAIDSTPGLYSGSVGLTSLGFGNVVTAFESHSYSSEGMGGAAGNEGVEVVYSMGDYGVHLSSDGATTEVAVNGTMNGITAGLALSDSDAAADTELLATVGGSFNDINLGLAYASTVDNVTRTTISMGMALGAATSMSAYVGDNGAATDNMNFGVGVNHSLGGGVAVAGGVARLGAATRADLGVTFNF